MRARDAWTASSWARPPPGAVRSRQRAGRPRQPRRRAWIVSQRRIVGDHEFWRGRRSDRQDGARGAVGGRRRRGPRRVGERGQRRLPAIDLERRVAERVTQRRLQDWHRRQAIEPDYEVGDPPASRVVAQHADEETDRDEHAQDGQHDRAHLPKRAAAARRQDGLPDEGDDEAAGQHEPSEQDGCPATRAAPLAETHRAATTTRRPMLRPVRSRVSIRAIVFSAASAANQPSTVEMHVGQSHHAIGRAPYASAMVKPAWTTTKPIASARSIRRVIRPVG